MKTQVTLRQIRQQHNITAKALAELTRVPLRTAYLAEVGGSIDLADAVKLLQGLSHITQQHYDLETVSINICATRNEYPPTIMLLGTNEIPGKQQTR